MSLFVGFFVVLLVLFIVIGIHELGHALAAIVFRVKIQRVSFGLGRPILSYQAKSGIEYAWSLWPVGGYVKLLNSRIHSVTQNQYARCFDKQSCWKKIAILASGALMNFLVAIVAFQIHFLLGYQEIKPVVSKVSDNSVAYSAGFRGGDEIIRIDGHDTTSWQQVGMQVITRLDQHQVPVDIKTPEGKIKSTTLDIQGWQFQSRQSALLSGLGIIPDIEIQHRQFVKGLGLWDATVAAGQQFIAMVIFFLTILKLIFTGYLPFAILLGPAGAISAIILSFYHGLSAFVFFIGYLSIAVGFINLMPVPGLDGGSIVYAMIEKIRRKPISVALEVLLMRLAMIVFVVVMIQLVMNDLQRYVS